MKNSIGVRAARADDKDAVIAFCQNTFSWGDYIDEVYDAWLASADGRLIVGVIADQPVGLLHVGFSDDVGWMEGMRVHPDFRQHGVASAMDAWAREVAREQGCRVARLATSIKNVTAQKAIATFGYHIVARFNNWEVDSIAADFSRARMATLDDVPAILDRWNNSAQARASHFVAPTPHWRWLELTAARLQEQILAGEMRVAPHGFVLLPLFEDDGDRGLSLHALVGDDDALHELALAARGEAHHRGYPHVSAMLVDDPALNGALENAGYHNDGGMLICEQEL